MSDSSYSRRNFFVRAGQVGCALTVLGPGIGRGLLAETTADTAALANGILPSRAAIDPDAFSGLQWRMLGPFRGGRCAAASGVPGRPNEFYFGAVNGGVWKTIDAGRVWDAGVRLAAGRIDRRDRRRAVGAGHRLRRQRRVDAARLGGLRQRRVQVDRRREDLDAPRPRRHAAHRQDRRRSAAIRTSCSSRRSGISTRRTRSAASSARATAARRWQKVLFKNDDVGAVEVVIDPTNSQRRLRGSVEYAPAALVHLRADERPGRRHLQVDRRRRRRGSSSPTACRRKASDAPASRSRRAIRGACTRSSIACCPSPARRPRRRRLRGRRGGAAQPPPGQGGFFRSDDAGATWTRLSSDHGAVGTRLVLREGRRRSEERRHRLRAERRGDRARRTAARRGSRCAARRAATTTIRRGSRPTTPNTMIVASDQGAIITRNAQRRRSARRDVELVAQPADGADLSHLGRLSLPVLGDRRAAGLAARSPCARAASSPRSRCATGSRSAPAARAATPRAIRCIPGIIFGGTGQRFDLETNTPMPGTTAPQSPRDGARRLDAAARVLEGRSARAVLREPVPVQDDRRRADAGRRSAPISRGPIPAFRRRSTRRPRRTSIATASAA